MEQEVHAATYLSPLGKLTIACTQDAIIGLWIEGQKYFASTVATPSVFEDTPLLRRAHAWLDAYFAGKAPSPDVLPLQPQGSPFRQAVWQKLCRIPYGQTVSYGQLALEIASGAGRKTMSAQAIGGAVGHNPISIIIPCHRVLGAQGQLTGYAGGVEKKLWLLRHEGVEL